MKWQIGSVPYLNAKPLIYGIEEETRLAVPSELSMELRKGDLDAALVPIAEFFENPKYHIVPGIGIATHGPVRSVYLAHKLPIAKIKKVTLDPNSKTSNLLLQVILKEFFGLNFSIAAPNRESDGQLLIGDRALIERKRFIDEGFHILDLGETWVEQTQLPFVFAFWAVRPEVSGLSELISTLQSAKMEGLENLATIADEQRVLAPESAVQYLTRCIAYDLGEKELKGIIRFQELCFDHGLILEKSAITMAE